MSGHLIRASYVLCCLGDVDMSVIAMKIARGHPVGAGLKPALPGR